MYIKEVLVHLIYTRVHVQFTCTRIVLTIELGQVFEGMSTM